MELGQKLRQARLKQGLSQKELCGDRITRNMLSLIENGSATPSMDTLLYLAGRLGLPLSALLEEDPLEQARQDYQEGRFAEALAALEGSRQPEAVLLTSLCKLSLAQQELRRGNLPHARQLLEQVEDGCYDFLLEREKSLLLAQVTGKQLTLPADDRELLLRARDAMDDPARAAAYLQAAQNQDTPAWNYLRGQVYYQEKEYAKAKQCLQNVEEAYPKETAPLLERCCEALEDFKGAYYYAKKAQG